MFIAACLLLVSSCWIYLKFFNNLYNAYLLKPVCNGTNGLRLHTIRLDDGIQHL